MPWILWGMPFSFLLSPAIQTAHVTSVKCSENFQENQKDNSDCNHPPLSATRNLPAAQHRLLPWLQWHLHPEALVMGGTSITFTIRCTDKSRTTKQGKLICKTAWRMAGTRAANTIRPQKCCKRNALLPPSTLPTKLPPRLSTVLTCLQLWSHRNWL